MFRLFTASEDHSSLVFALFCFYSMQVENCPWPLNLQEKWIFPAGFKCPYLHTILTFHSDLLIKYQCHSVQILQCKVLKINVDHHWTFLFFFPQLFTDRNLCQWPLNLQRTHHSDWLTTWTHNDRSSGAFTQVKMSLARRENTLTRV